MIQKLESFMSDDSLQLFICSSDYYRIDLSTSCLLKHRVWGSRQKFYYCLSKDWYLYNDTTFCRRGMEKWKIIYYWKFFPSVFLRFAEKTFFKIKYSKLDFAVMWCLSKLSMTPQLLLWKRHSIQWSDLSIAGEVSWKILQIILVNYWDSVDICRHPRW